MARKRPAKKSNRARASKRRVCRPPRLRPDRRRVDPELFVGSSPQDPPPTPEAVFSPTFDGETFTTEDLVDVNGTLQRVPGRPRKPMAIEDVERLALLHPTDQEVAIFFGVSVRTVERRKLLDVAFR